MMHSLMILLIIKIFLINNYKFNTLKVRLFPSISVFFRSSTLSYTLLLNYVF